jgi:transposase
MLYLKTITKVMVKNSKQTTASPQLAIINRHTAAIDVGSMLMMVAYTDAHGHQHLMETDGFTESLDELAKTLQGEGVTHVAMEATGVYWMALYEKLEQHGLVVTLINPQHFKNVDAQKTDVKDCQWLQQLHAHGLLRASHIAPELYRELKSYLHERNILQKQKSDTLNRIHRLLTQMNIKVQHLISDLEGVAGMKLLRAIALGISDPQELLSRIDVNKLKATNEDLLKSLRGCYKEQYLFILQHALKAYDFFKEQMKSYELKIEAVLKKLLPENEQGSTPVIARKKGLVRKNQYSINLKEYLRHITGVDITKIDGLDEITSLEIVSVTGIDMNKWPSADHFTSWLNLSPRPKISGGKILGHQKRFTNNKATQAFRMAAQSMWKHKGGLGQLYRRLSAQKGSKKAIKAIARKLAVIFYTIIKNNQEYDKSKMLIDSEKQQLKKITRLRQEAIKYGFTLQTATS